MINEKAISQLTRSISNLENGFKAVEKLREEV